MMASADLEISKSSAAFYLSGCEHQARNGHAKGEFQQSHLLCGTARDDCQTIHYQPIHRIQPDP
jgi:hypothetical protein